MAREQSAATGNFSRIAFWGIVLILALSSIFHNKLFSDKVNVIKWDGYGYYVHLPAVFIYKQAGTFDFVSEHMSDYAISDKQYQIRELENGKKYSVYNIGLSVLWLPFFFLGHLIAIVKSYPSDGMSAPYQWSVILASIFYVALGFFFLRKFLCRYLSDGLTFLSLLVVAFGTNFFYYATDGIELTHIYLFGLQAIFIYCVDNYFREKTKVHFYCSALILGLMTLVRSSEILLIIIPALWGFSFKDWMQNIVSYSWKRLLVSFKFLLVALAIFSLQLFYYRWTTGLWYIDGYEDHYFDFLNPHLYECFIGYRRGWLIYTPVMVLGLAGIGLLIKRVKDWFWPILIFISTYCYVIFSWEIWWYGSTFGCRPIVQAYALLALPLGITFSFFWQRSKWLKYLLILLCGFFIFLNLFQTWQFHKRIIPQDLVNKAYYWKVFLKTERDKHDNVFIDIPESIPASASKVKGFFQLDSSVVSVGKQRQDYREYITILDTTIAEVHKSELSNNWLRFNMDLTYAGDAFTKWSCPKLVMQVTRKNETLKYTALRIPHVIRQDIDKVSFDIQAPELNIEDKLKIYLWNTTKDEVSIDGLDIEIWK